MKKSIAIQLEISNVNTNVIFDRCLFFIYYFHYCEHIITTKQTLLEVKITKYNMSCNALRVGNSVLQN